MNRHKGFVMHLLGKNRSMGPVLIRTNITTGVNVVFEKIITLIRVRHIVSNNRVTVQTKM